MRLLHEALERLIQFSGEIIAQVDSLLARRKQMKLIGSRLLLQDDDRKLGIRPGADQDLSI